jgi:hypothetical protein
LILQAPVDHEFNRFNESYLLPLVNHLDFNVIGLGRFATMFPQRMIDFISSQLQSGLTLSQVGPLLIDEYQRLELVALQEQSRALTDLQSQGETIATREQPQINIGGFFVSEFERHQELDASWLNLLEINQLRLFFSSQINPSSVGNRMASWQNGILCQKR